MDHLTRGQIVIHYLKQYLSEKKSGKQTESVFAHDFFTFAERQDIRVHLKYPPDQLLSDRDIIDYTLQKWKEDKALSQHPNQAYIERIIRTQGSYGHYLNTKFFTHWDAYDHANFNTLKVKSGRAKYGYAIFTSDVKPEDIHHVTSKPQRWFTDLRLAESKKEEMVLLDKFKDDELVIHQDLRPL